MSSTNNTVHIKKYWDYAPHIDREFGYHVMRKNEQQLLIDFLYRRQEGSLLLSGKRGVGKTSAIFKAIHGTQDQLKYEHIVSTPKSVSGLLKINPMGPSTIILPVLVNAPNFEIRKESSEKEGSEKEGSEKEGSEKDNSKSTDLLQFKRLVLQTLVRRLYEAAKKDKLIEDELHIQRKKIFTGNIIRFLIYVLKVFSRGILSGLNRVIALFNEETDDYVLVRKVAKGQKAELRTMISNLYRRAVATEFRQETNLQEMEQEKDRVEKQIVKNFQATQKIAATAIVSTIVAIIIAIDPLNSVTHFIQPMVKSLNISPDIFIKLSKVIPILIGTIPPAVVTISWQMKKTATIEHAEERKASIYYRYDYDVSTLQSELEEVLRKLSQNYWQRYRVVFVIDELDKMDTNDVIDVIKSLKTLFNQSSALFVLVTAEDLFNRIMESAKKRKKEYTLFSQRIFLQRPKPYEIKEFMDSIADDMPEEVRLFGWELISPGNSDKLSSLSKSSYVYDIIESMSDAEVTKSKDGNVLTIKLGNKSASLIMDNEEQIDAAMTIVDKTQGEILYEFTVRDSAIYLAKKSKQYAIFQHYAAYAAKSDFFDLYSVIRDHISNYDGGRPVLNITLDRREVIQANLQKAMGQVYSLKRYKHPSNWHRNDLLLDQMYKVIDNIIKRKPETSFELSYEPSFTIIFPVEFSDRLEIIRIPDRVEAGAIGDLIVYLTWLGALRESTKNKYEITGNIKEVPDKPNIYTQEEDGFIREYEKLQYIVLTYASLYKELGEDEQFIPYNLENFSQYNDLIFNQVLKDKVGVDLDRYIHLLIPIYDDLKPIPIRHHDREDLQTPMQSIFAARDSLIQNLVLLIKRIINSRSPDIKEKPLSSMYLRDDLGINIPNVTSPTPGLIMEAKSSKGHDMRIFIIQNTSADLTEEIKRAVEAKKIDIHAIIFTPNMPTEVDFLKKLDEVADTSKPYTDSFLIGLGLSAELKAQETTVAGQTDLLNLPVPTNIAILRHLISNLLKCNYSTIYYGVITNVETKFVEAIEKLNYSPQQEEFFKKYYVERNALGYDLDNISLRVNSKDKVLFNSHSGNGTTTELVRISQWLQSKGYVVLRTSVLSLFQLSSEVPYIDILLFLIDRVLEVTRDLPIDLDSNTKSELESLIKQIGGDKVTKRKTKQKEQTIDDLISALIKIMEKGGYKTSSFLDTIRRSSLIKQLVTILNSLAATIEKATQNKLVILLDDFGKTTDLPKVLDSILKDSNSFAELDFCLILVAPPYILPPEDLKVINLRPVQLKNEDGSKNLSDIDFMRSIIRKRVSEDIFSDDATMLAVELSEGSIVDLLRIAKEACNQALSRKLQSVSIDLVRKSISKEVR